MSNLVAIVTGASRGIGKSIAHKLLDNGYRVCVTADDRQELADAYTGISEDRIILQEGDLIDLNFAESLVELTIDKWKQIDVLVNNAAWRVVETLRTMTVENWEKTLRICLTAPTFLAKWVASHMENQKGGVIINMSSIMSERPGGTGAAYIACKGAIESLTYEMAALYGPCGIRVVAVSPGNIKTKLSQDFVNEEGTNITDVLVHDFENHTPLQRSGLPEEVANAVLWICSKEASYITGTTITIDGGFSRNFNSYHLKRTQFPTQF